MESYIFPVAIGDTVKAKIKDGDKVDEVSYLVHGVAQIGDKQYVIDESGEMYEIGSKLCLIDEANRKRRCSIFQRRILEHAGGIIGRCQNPRNGLVYELTDDTDYCSYGERRTDDEG